MSNFRQTFFQPKIRAGKLRKTALNTYSYAYKNAEKMRENAYFLCDLPIKKANAVP